MDSVGAPGSWSHTPQVSSPKASTCTQAILSPGPLILPHGCFCLITSAVC